MAEGQPDYLKSALVAIDPKTGGVLAYHGSKDGKGVDYADLLQEPGSSFKPFVTLAGLEANKGLGQVYDGSSPRTFAGQRISNSENAQCPVCDVREATTRSINTVFVDMAMQVGTKAVARAAHDAASRRR